MLAPLQNRLGYTFGDPSLLQKALTHPSFLQDHPEQTESNQRLEFLGDAVLQLVLSEVLFHAFPEAREGELSKNRSALSQGKFLHTLALELGIDHNLYLGQSEEQTGGRTRPSILEDALEAILGAIYLDSDLPTARAHLLRWIGPIESRLQDAGGAQNPKGKLQELVQAQHGNHALRYESLHASGEDHAREYESTVYVLDKALGSGRGSSKKAAEEAAAIAALAQWPKSE